MPDVKWCNPRGMIRKKIFVVEDDAAIRGCMTDLLESEGYDVTSAENGQTAINYLCDASAADLPNLILLDLMMPVKDGSQFCTEKEAIEKLRPIPVILMSGDWKLSEKSAQTCAVAHLLKPVDINIVLGKVKEFCA